MQRLILDNYQLSAIEVRDLTGWPEPMVNSWLEAVKNLNDLSLDVSSVRGSVSSLGAATGSGFTSAKTGTGIYTVTFNIAKQNANYIVLPVAGAQGHTCTYENKTVNGFGVRITNAGVLADADFNFMVKV